MSYILKMKELVKHLLGYFYCFLYRVNYCSGLYIGLGAKLSGGASIKLSRNVKIMPQAMLVSIGKGIIEIGENSEISMYSRVASMGIVRIGNNVLTGPHVFIADYNHEYQNPLKPVMCQGNRFIPKNDDEANLLIDDGTWIGTNVVIVGNVHVGKHCVIGANSVVTKDIPDYSVAAGIPAKVIKKYDFEKEEWVRV